MTEILHNQRQGSDLSPADRDALRSPQEKRREELSALLDSLLADLKGYNDYYKGQLLWEKRDRWTEEIHDLRQQILQPSKGRQPMSEAEIEQAIKRLTNRFHYELSGNEAAWDIDPEDRALFERRKSLLELVEFVLYQVDMLDDENPGAKLKPGYSRLRQDGADLRDEIHGVTNAHLLSAIPIVERKAQKLGEKIRSYKD